MDKHTESDNGAVGGSMNVERALEELFHAVAPSPSFVAHLEEQLRTQREEQMNHHASVARQRVQSVAQDEPLGGFWAKLVALFSPRPRGRLSWALVALLAFLFLATATVAMSGIMSQLFGLEAGLKEVDLSGLYHDIEQSQTINGMTVTVDRAYADANRIVIAYIVETQNEQQELGSEMLKDNAGHEFQQIGGMGVSGSSELMGTSLPPGVRMQVLSFDASSVQGQPTELELLFTMPLRERVLPPPQTATPLAEENTSDSPEIEKIELGGVIGEYRFEFSVPFLPAETFEVQQTVELETVAIEFCPLGERYCTTIEPINNLAVRLEQVIMTPSETRAKLCVNLPAEWRNDWGFITSLESDAGQKMRGGGGVKAKGEENTDETCEGARFLDTLPDDSTTWTLSVDEIIVWDENLNQQRLQGPWRFQFESP